MKTLKSLNFKKILTWNLVVMFASLQIIPAGWSAPDSEAFRRLRSEVTQPEVAVKNSVTPELIEPSSVPSGVWVPDGPLSATESLEAAASMSTEVRTQGPESLNLKLPNNLQYESRIILPGPQPGPQSLLYPTAEERREARKAVVDTLIDLFHWTREQVETWMKQGLLKIKVDLRTLKVIVSLDPSIQNSHGLNSNLDLLGDGKLPSRIEFQLSRNTPVYYPDDLTIYMEFNRFNIVSSKFELDGKKYDIRFDTPGQLIVTVQYDPPQDGIASREVTLSQRGGLFKLGQQGNGTPYLVDRVVDRNSVGNIIVITELKYDFVICLLECSYGFSSGVRKDAEGNVLSEIKINSSGQTIVVLPDQTEHPVTYQGLEDLLEQVLKLEKNRQNAVMAQVRTLVTRDLYDMLNDNRFNLEELIRQGLIRIEINLRNLTAEVWIDASVEFPRGPVNLLDPLGLEKISGELKIQYQLGGISCANDGPCASTSDGPYLVSGRFNVGEHYFVELYYGKKNQTWLGNNTLPSVKIYDGDPLKGGKLLREIVLTYRYENGVSYFDARITYFNDSEPGVSSREVTLVFINQLHYRIQSVVDKDSQGRVMARNEFQYQNDFDLDGIVRTDANGHPLSEIQITEDGKAEVTLPAGSGQEVSYQSIEDLLAQAFAYETERGEDGTPVRVTREDLIAAINASNLSQAAKEKALADLESAAGTPEFYQITSLPSQNPSNTSYTWSAGIATFVLRWHEVNIPGQAVSYQAEYLEKTQMTKQGMIDQIQASSLTPAEKAKALQDLEGGSEYFRIMIGDASKLSDIRFTWTIGASTYVLSWTANEVSGQPVSYQSTYEEQIRMTLDDFIQAINASNLSPIEKERALADIESIGVPLDRIQFDRILNGTGQTPADTRYSWSVGGSVFLLHWREEATLGQAVSYRAEYWEYTQMTKQGMIDQIQASSLTPAEKARALQDLEGGSEYYRILGGAGTISKDLSFTWTVGASTYVLSWEGDGTMGHPLSRSTYSEQVRINEGY